MTKLRTLLPALLLGASALWGQADLDPVKWSLELEPATAAPGERVVARLKATVDQGWHLYASTTPQGKPIALQFEMTDSPAIDSWKAYQPEPERQFDELFGVESQWYVGVAEFLVELTAAQGAELGEFPVEAKLRYGACDAKLCLPPTRRTATATLTIAGQSAAAAPAIPDGYEQMQLFAQAAPPPASAAATQPAAAGSGDQGLLQFAAVAFGFGLLAIFTPCVFPMIPITMSYFVSTQSGEKRASLLQAVTFCVGVIVLFTGMGAAVSAILGPFGMQQLGSNLWVNLFIALIFFTFGASLMGAFEITVPSGAMTSLNKVSQGGGILGTLTMGLVFALASFACTGPFVGALLAGSVSGGGLGWPILGMLMFSTGLALPFFFLALFPSYLSRLPKAGGWMERVKITMAFVILAAGVKYLSNVDQVLQWHVLTRERFLALWVVLFGLAGVYLLGLIRLDEGPESKIGLVRLGVGGFFLAFALSLIPGMFGARLGEVDAYVPSWDGSAWIVGGGSGAESKQEWFKDDYQGALARARETGRAVLVNFTGYTCTNCKWMKTNMFPKPEIRAALDKLIGVDLYTDALDEALADANQRLQREKFNSIAVPFYAIVDADGNTLATFAGSTRNVEEFRAFLSVADSKILSRVE